MKTLALVLFSALMLGGCVVVPIEPVAAVYATPPAVVVTPRHHHRYHRHHRHRYWR